jgi:8-oxo-dGTP diphosphatase
MAGIPKVLLKVRLILYHKGQILLLKQTKPNGGNYTLVGGTVEAFETAPQALIREAFEEAGVVLREKDLQLVHVLQKVKNGEQRITLYFKTYRWEGQLMAREVHKFKECEWFHLDKLPKNLTQSIRHVLQKYRDGVPFSAF